MLREAGHEVFDFRNPAPGVGGFNWADIDPGWQSWSVRKYREALNHVIAIEAFNRDKTALDWCDVCVLVMPCGRSAHLELGYAVGRGKRSIVILAREQEPELMYKFADHICRIGEEAVEVLQKF